MRKVAVIIFVFLMIFNVVVQVPRALAADNSEFINVSVDGKDIMVRKINVIMNGQPLQSDVSPILFESRTLVPIRFVADQLGAEIEWLPDTMEAKIIALGKEIVLKINSADVFINGEKKQLPYEVPAKLVNNRTMVPLRFLMEELSCDVEWKDATWTGIVSVKKQEVTDIRINDNTYSPSIIVETTGEVLYKTIELNDSNKLVIDIPNTSLNMLDKNKVDDKNIINIISDKLPIKSLRSSQFQVNPDITRVVVDLEKSTDYKINHLKSGKGIEINFINRVTDITLDYINDSETLVINNTGEVQFNTFILENPNRIVLDIKNSYYENEKYEYDLNMKFVENVRVAQFEPTDQSEVSVNTVRIVLDLVESEYIPHIETRIEDGNLLVTLGQSDTQVIEYVNKEADKVTLNINTLGNSQYEIKHDVPNKLLEIIIPQDKIKISNGLIPIDDEFVKNIIVVEDKGFKKLFLNMKFDISYVDQSIANSSKITLDIKKRDSQFNDKLIVIDAGHGGKDPGTRGRVSKVNEKDLNLVVAFKLQQILEDLGFRTVLTRDKDEYIGLYERADIANATNGDAFVSIHFNAHSNSDIGGVETIYCPAYESNVKTGDNYPFAETLHNEVLKALNKVDRGIDRRPEIVVTRETKMVAALMELGFISNPEEERQVLTYEYLENSAQGIANGIVKYFSEE